MLDDVLSCVVTYRDYFDKTVKELGKIDILVNNASTQEQSMNSFTEIQRYAFVSAEIAYTCKSKSNRTVWCTCKYESLIFSMRT